MSAARPKETLASQLDEGSPRMPKALDDTLSMIDEIVEETAAEFESPIGLPARKYSFNALVAVGVVGFVIGRLLSR